ncbi:MAG: restriction endonuclease subunit S [Bacteroidales bacterium]|nr:restriction endonuclease subunit S [Bacteroidales bacterium]MCF8386687.1 restriction endonuclease subunit S [Bacteroidales bacterium]
MELTKNYKHTDYGIIPTDWKEIVLGKSSLLKARIGWQGLTTAEYLKDGNYYLITGTEFKDGFIDWDSCYYVSKERYEQDKFIQVNESDILITKDGTIGKVAFVEKVTKPATLNSGVFVIRPLNNSYNPRFTYYILRSNHFKTFLNKLSAGSTINHLYQKDFVHYKIPLPPTPEEQQSIVIALSDIDTLIANLDKLIAKKKAIKQGAMQQILKAPDKGGKRLPEFEGEWVETTIGQIARISTGSKNTQDRIEDGKYPFFVRSQIVERINTYSFEGEGILTAGDGVGTGKVFHYVNERIDIHQRVYLISDFKPSIDGYFLFLIFKENFYDRIMSMTAKSSVDSVRKEMITGMNISVPPTKEEQQEIASILLDMDKEIETLESKKTKYILIKQGMMQELLTGKTRLI